MSGHEEHGIEFSADGNWWWDGEDWQPLNAHPGAVGSARPAWAHDDQDRDHEHLPGVEQEQHARQSACDLTEAEIHFNASPGDTAVLPEREAA
jgi:hypothetical protein